ncbi:glycosyltransferase family 32 protein [[Candida] arabinofermentans NRRL YB-2248]|uniref:Glycosyltransferase family 32 protein n=1 Tax=[Candida] arabinofermentans NRRL YB-2248 TaxID=983967 RepID=A0A1E4SUK9_9ASCO|nr:glycosyltransferase family 32 protein [[Candida] arabinofermentans NRRL YB-2248]
MNYINIHDDTKKIPNYKQLKNYLKLKSKSIVLIIFIIYTLFKLTSTKEHQHEQPTITSNSLINFKTYGSNLQSLNKLPSSANLRDKLTYYFPYDSNKPIPNQIWQTWKTDLDSIDFPSNFKKFQKSWDVQNIDYNHYIIPDTIIESFITDLYSNVPEIIKTYRTLPYNILKADFFRYLILFARGGVYSDIDTICLKPISNWSTFDEKLIEKSMSDNVVVEVNSKLRKSPIGLIIGIEADPNRPDWSDWYARRIQFCQWTIQSKKGHPFLKELILRIVNETNRKLELNTLNKIEGKDKGGDIMTWTGPAIFTDTLFDYLNNIKSNGELGDGYGIGSSNWLKYKKYNLKKVETEINGDPKFSDLQTEINWKNLSGLQSPFIIDDVMILPITSFSPGVGQMGSKSVDDEMAFVRHMFEGSWKPNEQRMGVKRSEKDVKKG